MRTKFLLFILFCAGVLGSAAQNVKFQSSYLETTAKHLQSLRLDSLTVGANVFDYKGVPVVVMMNVDSVVTHIGQRIFTTDIRKEHPSPIYNYIEYAALDKKFHFTDNPFVYKDLKFLKGGWKDLDQVNDSTAFQVDVVQKKLYVVKWNDGDKDIVEMMFSVDYERLSMVSRKELEQNIIKELKKYHQEQTDTFSVEAKDVKRIDDNLWVKEGQSYLVPEITDNVYLATADTVKFSIIYDAVYPVETLANLCLMADMMQAQDTLDITFIKQDHSQEKASVRMSDFIAYMKENGCVPYWGTEKFENNRIEGALFLYNKDRGYDHVLKIEAMAEDIGLGDGRIKAMAYLLSPTTNVLDLNYKYVRKSKKQKIKQ